LLESPAVTALLEAHDLAKRYRSQDGRGSVRAVDGVSMALGAGETLGIVGESGCGKSTLGRLLLRLIEPDAGVVRFAGEDLMALDSGSMRRRRRDMQMVFQDPYASLDPRMTVRRIIAEPLDIHRLGTTRERALRVEELLDLVGLDPAAASRYPHEFSGGQRQRIGIARALALEPRLVILDEPVSALDVSIQSQILNLLADLKRRLGLAYVLISHDLSVIAHMCDRVAVMYLGRIVETGPSEDVFDAPCHPYTQALLSAMPGAAHNGGRPRIVLAGEPPNPEQVPPGCRFHPRCPKVFSPCPVEDPSMRTVGRQQVWCHLY
jgi:peptide/nickel transport system ATP-binding protein/oligopeptide transport system ATP-binding protein